MQDERLDVVEQQVEELRKWSHTQSIQLSQLTSDTDRLTTSVDALVKHVSSLNEQMATSRAIRGRIKTGSLIAILSATLLGLSMMISGVLWLVNISLSPVETRLEQIEKEVTQQD